MLPLQPVPVHLLVDVDDVALLQSQFPGTETKGSQLGSPFPAPPESLSPRRHNPGAHPPPDRKGPGREGTYLGDCAWKSNLSLAALLWQGEKGRVSRAHTALLHPDPAPTPFLTFFSSFLAGLPPRSDAGSVGKHQLSPGLTPGCRGVGAGPGLTSGRGRVDEVPPAQEGAPSVRHSVGAQRPGGALVKCIRGAGAPG